MVLLPALAVPTRGVARGRDDYDMLPPDCELPGLPPSVPLALAIGSGMLTVPLQPRDLLPPRNSAAASPRSTRPATPRAGPPAASASAGRGGASATTTPRTPRLKALLPEHVRKAADVWEREHPGYETSARGNLAQLAKPLMHGVLRSPRSRAFDGALIDVRRHRFFYDGPAPLGTVVVAPRRARQWRLKTSIWKGRPEHNDSHAFHDSADVKRRAIEVSYDLALRASKGVLHRFILKSDVDDEAPGGGGAADEGGHAAYEPEVSEVLESLVAHADLLEACFTHYAIKDVGNALNHDLVTFISQNAWSAVSSERAQRTHWR